MPRTEAADAPFTRQAAALQEQAAGLLARALQSGGSYADLFYERTVHHRLTLTQRLAGGRLHAPAGTDDRRVDAGAAIYAEKGGRTAHAAGADLEPGALRALAEAVAARLGGPASAPRILLSAPRTGPPLPPDAPDGVSSGEKAALLQAAADAAFSLDARVRRVEVRYQDRVRRTLVAGSDGRHTRGASLLVGLRIGVTLEVDGQEVHGYAVSGGAFGAGYFFEHAPERLAQEAVRRARRRSTARQTRAPFGPLPVVVAGGWGGVWLHEAVGHLLEADVVAAGASPWGRRLGQRIAPEGITLVDDATLEGGRGTAPFDDEGEPARATVLVEDGVLRTFLTDRRHAARMGLPRTGSGRRQDYRHPPLPRMSNLVLHPGQETPETLLAEVGEGLYVRTIGHGVVRPDEDRFSFEVVDGNRIDGGRLGGAVAGVRVHGPASGLLDRIAGVAGDFRLDTARGHCRKDDQVVPVSVGTPTVLIGPLTVEG